MNRIGQEAGKHVSSAAGGACKLLHNFGKQVSEAAPGYLQHLDEMGQEMEKSVWQAGRPGKAEDGEGAGRDEGQGWGNWMAKHPWETAGVAACVFAAPVSIAFTPVALGLAGFTSGGVAASSLAAAAHASIGNVVAGSTFAILQSAGAGGAGLATVNAVVGGITGAASVAGAVGIVNAAEEDQEGEKNKEEGSNEEEDTNEE